MRETPRASRARRHRLAAALGLLAAISASAPPVAAQLRFLVAGHTYGKHQGQNLGLCERFLRAMQTVESGQYDFLVLTGDFIRECDAPALAQLQAEIEALPAPVHLVMGNHEETTPLCRAWIGRRHGATFYRFERAGVHFVVLDSQLRERSISPEQVAFLRESLARAADGAVVFVFFHELLWLAQGDQYRYVRANRRSRQANLGRSNYWRDVHPLFEEHPDKRICVVAGDVGGNPDAIPAFFERRGHVTFAASGMGGAIQGNYLEVEVDGREVRWSLVALDEADAPLPPLESYTAARLSRLDGRGRLLPVHVRLRRWAIVHPEFVGGGVLLVAIGLMVARRRERRRRLRL